MSALSCLAAKNDGRLSPECENGNTARKCSLIVQVVVRCGGGSEVLLDLRCTKSAGIAVVVINLLPDFNES